MGFADDVALPARGEVPIWLVTAFLVDLAHGGSVKGGTFNNYVASLNAWAVDRGLPTPASHPELASKLKGIRRSIGEKGGNVVRRKLPLTLPLLKLMLADLDTRGDAAPRHSTERFRCRRDAVALVLGFHGMLRKLELAAATLGDLSFRISHWELVLPWSKVDQTRRGCTQWFALRTRSGLDLNTRLRRYTSALRAAGFGARDALLPNIAHEKVLRSHMPGHGVAIAALVKEGITRVASLAAGAGVLLRLEPGDYSLHSLRRGGCNHAVRCGHSREAIMVFGRWASDAVDAYRVWDDVERIRFVGCM